MKEALNFENELSYQVIASREALEEGSEFFLKLQTKYDTTVNDGIQSAPNDFYKVFEQIKLLC